MDGGQQVAGRDGEWFGVGGQEPLGWTRGQRAGNWGMDPRLWSEHAVAVGSISMPLVGRSWYQESPPLHHWCVDNVKVPGSVEGKDPATTAPRPQLEGLAQGQLWCWSGVCLGNFRMLPPQILLLLVDNSVSSPPVAPLVGWCVMRPPAVWGSMSLKTGWAPARVTVPSCLPQASMSSCA